MQQYIAFAQENWVLITLWFTALAVLVMSENRKSGQSVTTSEATRLMNHDDALVLDIREQKEYAEGHIPGAFNLPMSALEKRVSEIDKYKEKPVVVVCRMGSTAGAVGKTLKKSGFSNVVRMAGGMMEWNSAGLQTKKGKSA